MIIVKQGNSVVVNLGPFLDKTDGITAEDSIVAALDHATTGIQISKAGAAWAVRNATVTASVHGYGGHYRVTLDTTDTGTLGSLRMAFHDASVNLPAWLDMQVVEAEVYDALFGAGDGEPGTGAPPLTANLAQKIGYLYKAWRNRTTQNATTYTLYNDNGTTAGQTAAVSDNGTLADKNKLA